MLPWCLREQPQHLLATPRLGLTAEGEAFVSVRVFYPLPVRAFLCFFLFQVSSFQVAESLQLTSL